MSGPRRPGITQPSWWTQQRPHTWGTTEHRDVVQLGEQRSPKPHVAGSSPVIPAQGSASARPAASTFDNWTVNRTRRMPPRRRLRWSVRARSVLRLSQQGTRSALTRKPRQAPSRSDGPACETGACRGEYVARQHRGVAQLGSASGLGPESRRFKSCHPDSTVESSG